MKPGFQKVQNVDDGIGRTVVVEWRAVGGQRGGREGIGLMLKRLVMVAEVRTQVHA